MGRVVGDFQFDWFTISIHRPLLLRDNNYRKKILMIILKALPQTREVVDAKHRLRFMALEGKYEECLSIFGVRITSGNTMVRIEFQGMAFTRASYMFQVVIHVYYNIWRRVSIVKNGVEYEPPVITSVHVCKDIAGRIVGEVLPLPDDEKYVYRFKKRYKPIFRTTGEMEGYHISCGKYLLKAYRKDWEVLDKSEKNPIKYKYQKKYYGDLLNSPITRVELEVSGERQCRWITGIVLETFREALERKEVTVKIDKEMIFKGLLKKFHKRHRVLVVDDSKKRVRDWKTEARWESFFSGKEVLCRYDKHPKIEEREVDIEEIKKYLRIAVAKSIITKVKQKELRDIFSMIYLEVCEKISLSESIDKEVLYEIGRLIIGKELGASKRSD